MADLRARLADMNAAHSLLGTIERSISEAMASLTEVTSALQDDWKTNARTVYEEHYGKLTSQVSTLLGNIRKCDTALTNIINTYATAVSENTTSVTGAVETFETPNY